MQRAAELDRQAVVSLTRDLDRHRAEAQTEREALRAAHAEQLAQSQRNADERVHALTEALAIAKESAETYRAQLPPPSATTTRQAPRKRTQS